MFKKLSVPIVVFLLVVGISLAFISGCNIVPAPAGAPPQSQSAGLDVITQAWNDISQNYVDPTKFNTTALSRGAIKGIMDTLNDPYSAYLDPDTYKLFQSDIQAKFEGIGAEVALNKDNKPIVIAPLPNSPAAKAGIKTGDIILAINGQTTDGMSLVQVVLNVRGPGGTSVKLSILHDGETTPVDIEIVRAQITESYVNWQMKGNIAYIQIMQFGQNTNTELNNALTSIDLKNTAGIILDLRSNPGGLVQTVVDIASHFIKQGVIITLVDNKGNRQTDSVHPNGVFTDLPMVVLVDQYSASGSEVLTGALRDYKRATIAGVKTFGKGSYDIDMPLKDGSAIYLTVGRWLTPNGQLIEGKGIEPDYVLTTTGDAEIQWAIDFLKKPQQQ